ncbi:MAG: pentapeptide repeat-containing protein [Alphaproteobacteria bacterium]
MKNSSENNAGKLYSLVNGFLNDKERVQKILLEIAKKTSREEDNFFDNLLSRAKLIGNTALFGLNNVGRIFPVVREMKFFRDELNLLLDFVNNKNIELQDENIPFFIKRIRDQSLENYLTEDKTKEVTNFLQLITPELFSIFYNPIEKNADDKELSKIKDRLKNLESEPRPHTKKVINEIDELKGIIEKVEIVKELNEVGINKQYIQDKILPIVNSLTDAVLDRFSTIINLLNLAYDNKLLALDNPKAEMINIIYNSAELLDSDVIPALNNNLEILEEATPKFLKFAQAYLKRSNEQNELPNQEISKPTATSVLKSIFVENIVVENYQPLIPIVMKTIELVFQQDKNLFSKIYKKYRRVQEKKEQIALVPEEQKIILAEVYNKLRLELVDKILEINTNEIIKLVTTDLVNLIEANKNDIDEILADIVIQVPEINNNIKDLGIEDEVIKAAIPTLSELIITIFKDKAEHINQIKETYKAYRGVKEPKAKNEALVQVGQKLLPMIENKELWAIAQEKLSPIISTILKETPAASPLLEFIGADKVTDLALKAIPEILPIVAQLLDSVEEKGIELEEIKNSYKQYKEATEPKAKNEALVQVGQKVLPMLDNKELWQVSGKLAAEMVNEVDFLKPIFRNIDVKELSKFSSSLGEFAVKLLNVTISNPEIKNDKLEIKGDRLEIKDDKLGPEKLFNQIVEIMTSTAKEQDKKIDILIKDLVKFKKKYPDLSEIIDKDLPNLITDNLQTIGKIIDNVLKDTKISRILQLDNKGEKTVALLAGKLPQLIEIASAYKEGDFKRMVPKLLDIVLDEDVFKFAVTSAINFVKFKFNEFNTKRNLKSSLKENPENIDKLDKNHIGFKLKNLKLDNLTIDNFKFNEASLDNVSFVNSTITNTSFKNVRFNKKVSFSGATIDAESLKDLAPAIIKHNKEHAKDKITLNNIKITGDISKISLKGISLENTDLSEATIYSKNPDNVKFVTEFSTKNLKGTKLPGQEILDKIITQIKNAQVLDVTQQELLKEIDTTKLAKKINSKLDNKKLNSVIEVLNQNKDELELILKNFIETHSNNYEAKKVTKEISQEFINHINTLDKPKLQK